MEDAESIHMSLKNHPNIALFGVFDGHNGSAASQWLHEHLHEYLDKLDDPFSPEQLRKAMLQADADFLATDNKFAHLSHLFTFFFRRNQTIQTTYFRVLKLISTDFRTCANFPATVGIVPDTHAIVFWLS
jgi:serine/threonine protein phosphatase PrpC